MQSAYIYLFVNRKHAVGMIRIVLIRRQAHFAANGRHYQRQRHANHGPRQRHADDGLAVDQSADPALVHGAVDQRPSAHHGRYDTELMSIERIAHAGMMIIVILKL